MAEKEKKQKNTKAKTKSKTTISQKVEGAIGAGLKPALPSPAHDFEMVSSFDILRRAPFNLDKEREERLRPTIRAIEQATSSKTKTIKSNGSVIFSNFYSPHQQGGQKEVEAFSRFMKSKPNSFYAFDIETFGDVATGEGFHVSEIAIQGFQKTKEGLFKADGRRRMSVLIKPTEEARKYLESLIRRLEADRFTFNQMTQAERISIVNLIRYSTIGGNGIKIANLNEANLSHNSFVNSLYDPNGRINTEKFVVNFDQYIQHVKSGLSNLTSLDDRHLAHNALARYQNFIGARPDQFFFSYNGENFDLEALDKLSRKLGVTINRPHNHVDYYRLLQTVFPNPWEFHKLFGRNPKLAFEQGMLTLHEARRTLGISTSDAHAAIADVDDRGLGGVVSGTIKKVYNQIRSAKNSGASGNGFINRPAAFTWSSNEALKIGQTLFSPGGTSAFGQGEFDFQAEIIDGKITPIDPHFNKTTVNARTFYTVNDFLELRNEAGEIIGHTLKLYDSDNDRYAFITRYGANSMSQIQQFVQQRFYNWNGLTNKERQRIQMERNTDYARRRYERLSSLSGAGSGKTSGFEAAKRLYQNAEVYERRLLGKRKYLHQRAQELTMQEITSRNITNPQEINAIYQRHLNALQSQRISQSEMMAAMDFNSKAVFNGDQFVGWELNKNEIDSFFRMAPRLMSERVPFQEAMRIIEEQLPIDGFTGEQLVRAKQRRDMAWRIYTRSVDGVIGKHTANRALNAFENRGLRFMFEGEERYINFTSLETAEASIRRLVNMDGPDADPTFRHHRMHQLINALEENKAINPRLARRLRNIHLNNGQVNDTINRLALEMMGHSEYLNDTIEVLSMGQRDMSGLTPEINRSIVQDAIHQVLSYEGEVFRSGGVKFSTGVEKRLQQLEVDHLSGLRANNRDAIATVLRSIEEYGDYFDYRLSLNKDLNAPMAKITVFKPEHSTSVVEALMEGRSHPRAVEILIPLINQDGYQVIGQRNLIGHSVAVLENGKVVRKSTAQMIGMQYGFNIGHILNPLFDDDYELANARSKRVLNEAIENMAGSWHNAHNFNDVYESRGLMSDIDKMSNIRLMPAMIHDMLRTGRITENDLTDDAFYYTTENGRVVRKVKTFLTADHLKYGQYEKLMGIIDWANSANWEGEKPDLFFSGVKEGNAAKGILSTQDMAEKTLYGRFYNMARPNSIQRRNFYMITNDVAQKISVVGAYTNFDSLIDTESNWKFKDKYISQGTGYTGVNVKVAYMTTDQIYDKTMELYRSGKAENLQLLRDEGILVNRNGQEIIDPLRLKTVYEQQAVIAREIMEAVSFTDYQRFHKGDGVFQWNKKFATGGTPVDGTDFVSGGEGIDGAIVKPGDIIGRRYVDGNREDVVYEKQIEGRIQGAAGQSFRVEWTDNNPFKFSFSGEKGTDAEAASLRFIRAITGDNEVSAIISPNPGKRRDYGMMMEGYSKIIINELMKRDEATRQRLIQQLNLASIGIVYQNGRFVDVSSKMGGIDVEDFHRIANQLGVSFQTSEGYYTGILEMQMMRNPRYYSSVDETGRAVIGRDENGNKIYARGRDVGVSIGHREMNVLERIGAVHTYERAFNTMRNQGRRSGAWQDAINVDYAIMANVDENAAEVQKYKNRIVQAHQFNLMPEVDLDAYTIQNTILDHDAVSRNLGISKQELGHGYWLDLNMNVEVNLDGQGKNPVTINKLFIPILSHNTDGTDKIRLRKLQRQIASINDSIKMRARAQTAAGRGKESAQYWERKLESQVKQYFNQLVEDATTSKGLSGEGALKAHMSTSGSGLLKIVDPFAAQHIGDEVTWISTQQAKDMGIYEKLIGSQYIGTVAEQEILQDWTKQQQKYAMVMRYPTKHNTALQFTRIAIDPNLITGNVRTTAFTAEKLEGDADGDQGHIVYIDDDAVQSEWRQLQQERKAFYASEYGNWSEFLASQAAAERESGSREYDLREVARNQYGSTRIDAFEPNSAAERAGKLDKTQIGKISNLNRALQDYAAMMYSPRSEAYRILADFGSMLEQKGIDAAKAGASITEDGRHPAARFRNAFLRSDWNTVRSIANEHYSWMNESLDQVIDLLDATKGYGIDMMHPAFSVGTSTGIDIEKHGLRKAYEILFDRGAPEESVDSVQFTRMKRRMHRDTGGRAAPPPEPEVKARFKEPELDPYETMQSEPKPKRPSAAEQVLHDATGGWIPEDIFSGPNGARNKKIALLGGLALGGVMGYNVLRNDNAPVAPAAPPPPPAGSVGPVIPQSPLPPIQAGPSGATVAITAKGQGQQKSNMPPWIQEGMRRSGYQGQSNMTVNYSDNSANLSRIWYRDKVEQYV